MLYKIITGDRLVTAGLIFLIATALWIPAFLSPESYSDQSMQVFSIINTFSGEKSLLSVLFAFVLMLFEAFLLVRINAKLVLVQQKTFLPALFFILIASHIPELLQWNPVLPASLFVILVLEMIFRSNNDQPNSYRFFESGILLGIGSLFYLPLVYMLVFIWIACLVQRPFYWREYLFPVLGLLVPFLFVFSFMYLKDKNIPELIQKLQSNFAFSFSFPVFGWQRLVFSVYTGFLVLVASIFLLKVFQFRKIYIRDYFLVLFWLFTISFLMYLFLTGFNNGIIYLTAISISYILTNYFMNARKSVLNKLVLYILLGFVLVVGVMDLIG